MSAGPRHGMEYYSVMVCMQDGMRNSYGVHMGHAGHARGKREAFSPAITVLKYPEVGKQSTPGGLTTKEAFSYKPPTPPQSGIPKRR